MKNIQISNITLRNFKGIRDLKIDYSDHTSIFGDNATGKTTIFDAFCWLLFGKDSSGRSDFQIKPLDENNIPFEKVECEVSAVIYEDGIKHEIKRTLREKWVTKRGETEAVFTGNETVYTANNVPLTMGEYNKKIESIVPENIFKLITNPLAFNGEFKNKIPDWQVRRNILFDLAGTITNEDIAASNEKFKALLDRATGIDLETYKKGVNAKKKKVKEELHKIPTRLDELDRNTPEDIDFQAIENEVENQEKLIIDIDNQIEDSNKAFDSVYNEIQNKKTEIIKLTSQIQNIKFQAESNAKKEGFREQEKASELQNEIDVLNRKIKSHEAEIKSNEDACNKYQVETKRLREDWAELQNSTLTFDENEFHCPACKRAYEAENIEQKKEELLSNFNLDKSKQIEKISANGKELNEKIEQLNLLNAEIKKTISNINVQVTEKSTKLIEIKGQDKKEVVVNYPSEINDLENKIKEIENSIPEKPAIDNSQLKIKKQEMKEIISLLNKQLSVKDQIENNTIRKAELNKQQKELSIELAELEKEEYTINEFTKSKIELVESRINSQFKYAKFKMYETQINEGEKETCVTLCDGVPFPDLNNAKKIFVGIDIINTLCNHYQVSAPIFIDNRESIVRLPECKSQLINLIVSEQDKELRCVSTETMNSDNQKVA